MLRIKSIFIKTLIIKIKKTIFKSVILNHLKANLLVNSHRKMSNKILKLLDIIFIKTDNNNKISELN